MVSWPFSKKLGRYLGGDIYPKEALKDADEIKRAEIFKQQDELVEKLVGLSHKVPRLIGTRRVLGFILLQIQEIRTEMASI